MRRYRPHIPYSVRLQVATRQLLAESPMAASILQHLKGTKQQRLATILGHLFGSQAIELHHRPALVNRAWNERAEDYDPPANDPEFLIYLAKHDHAIETRVRGMGAQRSDLSQARYNKNVARNRSGKKPKYRWPTGRKISSRPFPKRPGLP